ncbi:MAG: ABC transporter permease, partial [Roseimicrobium sp.]
MATSIAMSPEWANAIESPPPQRFFSFQPPSGPHMLSLTAHPLLRLALSPQHLWRSIEVGAKSIWLHKLRSLLTALGVVFGVASVVAMLAIGEGASHEAQEQIRKLGSQNVILESIKPSDNQSGTNQTRSFVIEYGLTTRDINQIRQTVPGISIVVPSRIVSEFLWVEHYNVDAALVGALAIYPEMRNRRIVSGRFFTDIELDQHLPVCVLNQTAAARLFPLATPQGKAVRVRGSYYRVIGIIEDDTNRSAAEGASTSTSSKASANLAQMIIPFTTLMDQFGDTFFRFRSGSFEAEKVEFHEAIVRVSKLDEVVSRAEAIKHILARNHPKDDYRVTVPIELLRQAERTKRIFSIVLGSIAAISLLVGGIGIMNI